MGEDDGNEFDRFVFEMGAALGAHASVSHVLRALVRLAIRHREPIVAAARQMHGRVRRPPNGDAAAVITFESQLTEIILAALRSTALTGR